MGVGGDRVVTVDTVYTVVNVDTPTDSDDPDTEETEHLSNWRLQLARLLEQL